MATISIPDFFGAQQTVNVLPALGSSTKAGSLPVTIASDDAVTTGIGTLATFTGSAATSALQNTHITATGVSNGYLATVASAIVSPQTSGGQSLYRLLAGAGTPVANIKAAAGQIYGLLLSNTSGATVFLKLYDTSGTPTAGGGTPKMTLAIPIGNTVLSFDWGIAFATGIGLAITGAIADADTTAIAAGVAVNLGYK